MQECHRLWEDKSEMVMKRANHETPHNVIFSGMLLCPPSSIQTPSVCVLPLMWTTCFTPKQDHLQNYVTVLHTGVREALHFTNSTMQFKNSPQVLPVLLHTCGTHVWNVFDKNQYNMDEFNIWWSMSNKEAHHST